MDSQKTIEGLKALLDCNYIGSLSGEDIESLESAIDTMRKYQQIEQIVNAWDDDENAMILAHKIKEVIEDGNDK